jgi:hypothetical protein
LQKSSESTKQKAPLKKPTPKNTKKRRNYQKKLAIENVISSTRVCKPDLFSMSNNLKLCVFLVAIIRKKK